MWNGLDWTGECSSAELLYYWYWYLRIARFRLKLSWAFSKVQYETAILFLPTIAFTSPQPIWDFDSGAIKFFCTLAPVSCPVPVPACTPIVPPPVVYRFVFILYSLSPRPLLLLLVWCVVLKLSLDNFSFANATDSSAQFILAEQFNFHNRRHCQLQLLCPGGAELLISMK